MNYQQWNIPKFILEQTVVAFRKGQHETFVIWTAPLNSKSPICEIKRCIVPTQKPGFTALGAYVHIEGAELNRIQFDNFDKRERSVVQLHTHPSKNVNMSKLDIEWEVVKHIGALSIIVPSYCSKSLGEFEGVHVYERMEKGWRLWTREEINRRLVINCE